jgi:hypothetical protein
MFFCFSLFNFGYSSRIWGLTPHGLLHEKQVQKHQIIKQADQDPRLNGIATQTKLLQN